jgi:TRAP-type C4-dicarboxylate transport system substrate-binding protein
MFMRLTRCAVVATAAFILVPAVSAAEPIKLKLSFYTSDRSNVYQVAVKPFVDAVNAEGKGLIAIEVYFSGVLGKLQVEQPKLVLDGVADIAFVSPGVTPDLFHDNQVIELPGLFRDMREATLTYTRLIAKNLLKGYEDFFVVGAFASDPESIHSRPPVPSLDGLKGRKIRANNPTAAIALEKLGMAPAVMPINMISDAISSGNLDGAAIPPSMLFEFGIGRVASHHYFLKTSAAPLALLMNRKKFDSLPVQAQNIIRKYSGEWAAARFIEEREVIENQVMEQLKSDTKRKVVFPSQPDLEKASAAFKAVTDEVVSRNPRAREMLKAAESEVAKLRPAE